MVWFSKRQDTKKPLTLSWIKNKRLHNDVPYTYSIFTFLTGALATLKISSSTQSPYLPCRMSWFFSSTRLFNKMLLSWLSTYIWVFFSLIRLTVLSCYHYIIKVIHLAKVQNSCGRNSTIDVDFTLGALSDNSRLLGVCIMIVFSVPCGLVLRCKFTHPKAHK